MKFERGKRYDQKCKIAIGECFLYFRWSWMLVKIYISWFFNCFDDRFATNFFNIIGRDGTWFQKWFRHGLKKEGRMFRQKRHQIIKHGFVKTYLYFSAILIYKTTTTTTNISSSGYIMLEKNIILYYGTVLIMLPKKS